MATSAAAEAAVAETAEATRTPAAETVEDPDKHLLSTHSPSKLPLSRCSRASSHFLCSTSMT